MEMAIEKIIEPKRRCKLFLFFFHFFEQHKSQVYLTMHVEWNAEFSLDDGRNGSQPIESIQTFNLLIKFTHGNILTFARTLILKCTVRSQFCLFLLIVSWIKWLLLLLKYGIAKNNGSTVQLMFTMENSIILWNCVDKSFCLGTRHIQNT